MASGLISYGISLSDGYRWVGDCSARLREGAKPSDLPIVQSIRFESSSIRKPRPGTALIERDGGLGLPNGYNTPIEDIGAPLLPSTEGSSNKDGRLKY